MHPCQENYPCVYLKIIDHTKATCMCAHCPMERNGTKVLDKLTQSETAWTEREIPTPDNYEPPDLELLQRQADYKRLMEQQNTFERHNGAIRPKKVAT